MSIPLMGASRIILGLDYADLFALNICVRSIRATAPKHSSPRYAGHDVYYHSNHAYQSGHESVAYDNA